MRDFGVIFKKFSLLDLSRLSDPIALPIVVKIVNIIWTLHKDNPCSDI
jgi:hypothetical protein